MQRDREITIEVHAEDGAYWATVAEYPGLFASGDTEAELFDSVAEGLRLLLAEAGASSARVTLGDPVQVPGVRLVKKSLVGA